MNCAAIFDGLQIRPGFPPAGGFGITPEINAIGTEKSVKYALEAAKYANVPGLSYDTKRKLDILRTGIVLPVPKRLLNPFDRHEVVGPFDADRHPRGGGDFVIDRALRPVRSAGADWSARDGGHTPDRSQHP